MRLKICVVVHLKALGSLGSWHREQFTIYDLRFTIRTRLVAPSVMVGSRPATLVNAHDLVQGDVTLQPRKRPDEARQPGRIRRKYAATLDDSGGFSQSPVTMPRDLNQIKSIQRYERNPSTDVCHRGRRPPSQP